MVLGSDITGLIYFDDARLAQLVGTAALAVILFEGGLQTEWKQLRSVARPALSLATAGVLVTVLCTGLLAWWVLGVDVPMALLIGAIVGSTDAAAVFAVMADLNIRQRLKATLEAESGLNDPMAVFFTLLMLEWVQSGPPNLWQALGFLAGQMGLGLAFGVGFGKVTGWLLGRVRLAASGLYPILLLAAAIFTFAFTAWLGGSGFVAVYAYGVFLGSLELPYRQSIVRFHEGAAWLAQIGMFILLGLLVFPRQLMPIVVPGVAIAAGLMCIARPAAVWISTWGLGFTHRERAFVAWAGLRGAVPIVLATFPLLQGVPQSSLIFNVVFFVVLTSALVQGATITPLARRLGLVEAAAPARAITLELVGAEKVNVDLIEVVVPAGARVDGKRLSDLRLPEQVTVSAVLRGGRVVTPRGGTRLQGGDVLFILAAKEQTHLVRAILAEAED